MQQYPRGTDRFTLHHPFPYRQPPGIRDIPPQCRRKVSCSRRSRIDCCESRLAPSAANPSR